LLSARAVGPVMALGLSGPCGGRVLALPVFDARVGGDWAPGLL